ncbi:MAG: RNA pseudouridine synthase [Planctomycetaceae bacterium]|nr:RNA pseudouridine synthase [Planctomycetaceae bacterium]
MHDNESDAAESFPPLVELDDLAVFAKPPGMETISQTGGREFAALVRASRGEPGLTPVHRLDRDTSGAVLFARNGATEKELIDLFRRRLTHKLYLALCLGAPRNRTGRINRNLSEWGGGRRPVRVLKKGGLEASTGYQVLAASDEWAPGMRLGVVAFTPHQGRTHQIRVHAAALGYPVLGDDQYGDRAANRFARERLGLRRSALHAWRLTFPWRGETVAAIAPIPDDLTSAARAAMGEKNVDTARFFASCEDIF